MPHTLSQILHAAVINFGRQPVGGNPQLEINPVAELMMEVRHETTVTLGALYYLYAVNGGAPYDFGELEAGIAHGWFARESGHQPGCNLTNNCSVSRSLSVQ